MSDFRVLFCLYLVLIAGPFLADATLLSDEQLNKRVHSHLVIGDYASACTEASLGLAQYPDSLILWNVYLKALAKAGNEQAMLAQWRAFILKFPDQKENREVLECLAWAVIQKGATSSSPGIRVIAMLGAFFSQDAKGVAILLKGLSDSNSFLRAAALKLSSNLLDATLQEEVFRLFQNETVWNVRLEAIKAVGKLEIEKSREQLVAIIANDRTSAEEKVAAIEALVSMSDGIEREQINRLVQSNRAGLRLLACELVTYFEQIEDADILLPLIRDYHAEVRAKALHTFGLLRISSLDGQNIAHIASTSLSDRDPHVSITAAWLLTINDPPKGHKAIEPFLSHESPEVRHLAAAALASTGKYGVPLALKIFKSSTDPYVRMNLAWGLIGQRVRTMAACDCLYQGLTELKERWMWSEKGDFRILAPSDVKHDDAIQNYPEAVNQLVRLEILEMLALVHYPHAQSAIKSFLQERNWGISGMASALLLTEGDEDAVDLVKGLLNDSDQKVRMQAALILALWGKGEDSLQMLQDAYPSADRELKGQILEGLGRIGSTASLSFLVDRLQEPYQTQRIIAAAALLECLYH